MDQVGIRALGVVTCLGSARKQIEAIQNTARCKNARGQEVLSGVTKIAAGGARRARQYEWPR